MYALEHDEILRRVAGLADKDPNASVYCVDAVGSRFVDIPTDIAKWFSWTVSADSPLDLMAPNFRLAGSTLFRMCRQDGSAIGIVRMADRPNEDVELHLFNGGDFVTGVIVDIQSQRPSSSRGLPQSNVDTQRNAVISAGAAAAAAAPQTTVQPDSVRDRWEAWETRTQDQYSTASSAARPVESRPAEPVRPAEPARPAEPVRPAAPPPQAPRTMRVHTDAAGVISWVDDDAVEGLRRDRDELIGSRMADYVHRDDKVVASMEWGDLLANPHAERSFRAQYLRGDGTTVVLDRTDTNRLDSDDRIIEVKLVESAESVSDSQREFQTKLLGAISADPASAVAFVNSDRKVSFANSEWTRVAWLTQGSPISGLDEKLIDPTDFRTAIDRALRNDRRSTTNVLLRTAPDGGRFSANADVAPLRGPDGQHGAMVTLTKIVEINAAEVAAREDEQRGSRRPPTPTPPREERKDRSTVAIAGAGVAAAGAAAVASQSPPSADEKRSGSAWNRFRSDDEKNRKAEPAVSPATTAVQPAVPPLVTATDAPQDEVRRWWTKPRLTLAATLVTALAGFLRFWQLGHLPPGMSELEALSALEADRVLMTPSLYSTVGFGQPLGPMYVLGLVMRIFGDSLFVMRSVSAVVGTITVLAFFWFARRYGGWASTVGSAVLAAMVWHLHFSRIALGVIWWPLLIVLFLWVIGALFDKPVTEAELAAAKKNDADSDESFRSYPVPGEESEQPDKPRSMFWRWIVGGILLGLGVYVANTHWLLLIVLPIIMLPWTAFAPRIRRRGGFVGWLSMTLVAALVAAPMVWRLNSNGREVLDTFSAVDARGDNWSSLSFMTQLRELARWWGIAWGDLLGGLTDMTDGLGAVAPVHLSILIAAAVGLIVLLFKYQNGTTWIIIAILLVVPFGSALTADTIGLRPSLAMAPILALLAGVAVGWVADRFGGGSTGKGFGRAALVALPLTALMVGFSIDDYFWRFEDKPTTTEVYSPASDDAMAVIRKDGSFVNFYSAKQRWDGPRRTWQASGAEGEDRSEEFGDSYSPDATPNKDSQLFVLLDEYADDDHIGDVLSANADATITDGSVKEGYVIIKLEGGG